MSSIAMRDRKESKVRRPDEDMARVGGPTVSTSEFDELDSMVSRAKAAQRLYAGFDQEKVDAVFRAAALAASAARIQLAMEQ